jgi:Domain of unknown function (DUF4253)
MAGRLKVELEADANGAVRVVVTAKAPLPVEALEHLGIQFNGWGASDDVWLVTVQVWLHALLEEWEIVFEEMGNGRQFLDTSHGSAERRLLERLMEQETFDVLAPREGVRLVRSQPDLKGWLAPRLEKTAGLTHEDWQDAVRMVNEGMRWPRAAIAGDLATVVPPFEPGAFGASAVGAVPEEGAPKVAGIQLPEGSRWPSDPGLDQTAGVFWASDERCPSAFDLARRLAAEFPDTGLWPMLWDFEDEPSSYSDATADLSAAHAIDADTALAALWNAFSPPLDAIEPFTDGFPGTASAVEEDLDAPPFAPFGLAVADSLGVAAARVLLVPCQRPADAIGVLAIESERVGQEARVSILRSFERRFGAVPIYLAPSEIVLAVARQPRSHEQSLLLAAELYAFAPGEEDGRSGALRMRAEELMQDAADVAIWRLAAD